jgi:hypothetical protein
MARYRASVSRDMGGVDEVGGPLRVSFMDDDHMGFNEDAHRGPTRVGFFRKGASEGGGVILRLPARFKTTYPCKPTGGPRPATYPPASLRTQFPKR